MDWEIFESSIPPSMRVHLENDSIAEGSWWRNGGGTVGQTRDDSAPTAAASDADGGLSDPYEVVDFWISVNREFQVN